MDKLFPYDMKERGRIIALALEEEGARVRKVG